MVKKTKEQLIQELEKEKQKYEQIKALKEVEKEKLDIKKQIRELKAETSRMDKFLGNVRKGLQVWMKRIEENEERERINKAHKRWGKVREVK